MAGAARYSPSPRPRRLAASSARRWHLQAVAGAVDHVHADGQRHVSTRGDVLWFLVVVGAASTLVAMATSYRDGTGSGVGGVCLALDSAIVGFTTALMTVVVANTARAPSAARRSCSAHLPPPATPSLWPRDRAVRADPRGSDALFLGGVLVLCLNAAGEAARQIGLGCPALLAAPGVALFGTLGLARSAWSGPRRPLTDRRRPSAKPACAWCRPVAAAGRHPDSVVGRVGRRRHAGGFFGIIMLFGLIVGRLLLTLVENRQLLQRVERSGLVRREAARPRRRAGGRARSPRHPRAGLPHRPAGPGRRLGPPVDARSEHARSSRPSKC